jgi:hypothetical protein
MYKLENKNENIPNPNFNTFENDRNMMESAKVFSI